MKKFIYKDTEIMGTLIEETNTHYIVSIENGEDQLSLIKELTVVREAESNDTVTIEIVNYRPKMKMQKGILFETKKKAYLVRQSGESFIVFNLDKTEKGFQAKCYHDVYYNSKGKLTGIAGLPSEKVRQYVLSQLEKQGKQTCIY